MQRECGTCSLCCKLLGIVELGKPSDAWCQNCNHGHGCRIYADRPRSCRDFECQWLKSPSFSDIWFPPKARMVVYYDETVNPELCRVASDVMGQWRNEPYCSVLRTVSLSGLSGRDGRIFHTVATYRERHWLILPTADIEITGRHYTVLGDETGWHVAA